MKKLSYLVLSLSFFLLVIGKDVTFFRCAQNNSFHLFSSCCIDQTITVEKKSCCEVKTDSGNSTPEISSICCNKLDLQIDLQFTNSSTDKISDNQLITFFPTPLWNTGSFSHKAPLVIRNTGPPGSSFAPLPNRRGLHKALSIYIC